MVTRVHSSFQDDVSACVSVCSQQNVFMTRLKAGAPHKQLISLSVSLTLALPLDNIPLLSHVLFMNSQLQDVCHFFFPPDCFQRPDLSRLPSSGYINIILRLGPK